MITEMIINMIIMMITPINYNDVNHDYRDEYHYNDDDDYNYYHIITVRITVITVMISMITMITVIITMMITMMNMITMMITMIITMITPTAQEFSPSWNARKHMKERVEISGNSRTSELVKLQYNPNGYK